VGHFTQKDPPLNPRGVLLIVAFNQKKKNVLRIGKRAKWKLGMRAKDAFTNKK